jgi:hypothetical protein
MTAQKSAAYLHPTPALPDGQNTDVQQAEVLMLTALPAATQAAVAAATWAAVSRGRLVGAAEDSCEPVAGGTRKPPRDAQTCSQIEGLDQFHCHNECHGTSGKV